MLLATHFPWVPNVPEQHWVGRVALLPLGMQALQRFPLSHTFVPQQALSLPSQGVPLPVAL